MGLYTNKQLEPKVYKTRVQLKNTSNQDNYHINYLQEFVKEQGQLNSRLNESMKHVSSYMKNIHIEQKGNFNTLFQRIGKQEDKTSQFMHTLSTQEKPIRTILQRLQKLDNIHQTLAKEIKQDELVNQAIMDQLSAQDQAINKLSKKVEGYESMYEEITIQQNEQTKLYSEIIQKLQLQEAFHQTILEQLNKQEAVTQGISTQIESVKETLIEKVSTIIEKIESTYKSTTNYLFGIFSKPLSTEQDEKVNQNEREKVSQ